MSARRATPIEMSRDTHRVPGTDGSYPDVAAATSYDSLTRVYVDFLCSHGRLGKYISGARPGHRRDLALVSDRCQRRRARCHRCVRLPRSAAWSERRRPYERSASFTRLTADARRGRAHRPATMNSGREKPSPRRAIGFARRRDFLIWSPGGQRVYADHPVARADPSAALAWSCTSRSASVGGSRRVTIPGVHTPGIAPALAACARWC